MLDSMLEQFSALYNISGLNFPKVMIAIALALVFGAIWLAIFRVWSFNKIWWVVILLSAAILTWCAIAFIQIPLQWWTQEFLLNRMGRESYISWMLLSGLPLILLSGLVQEGAKLAPVIFYWYRRGRQMDPLTGLYAGAIAGAGFGILEAVWVHNMILGSGWTWELVSVYGVSQLLGFWERLFAVGLHIGVSALAGYGWAKGLRWQFYLIAVGLHSLSNYGVLIYSYGTFNANQVELYLAVITIATAVLAFMMLRKSLPPEDSAPLPESEDDTGELPYEITAAGSGEFTDSGAAESPVDTAADEASLNGEESTGLPASEQPDSDNETNPPKTD